MEALKISFPIRITLPSSTNPCLITHIAITANAENLTILNNIKDYVLQKHDQTDQDLSATEVVRLIYNQLTQKFKIVKKIKVMTQCGKVIEINSSETVKEIPLSRRPCSDISQVLTEGQSEIKVAFLYDATGSSQSAERSASIIQLNELIFAQFKDSNSIEPKYIGITRVPETDRINLEAAVEEGYEVFCSALGSAFVLYLAETYFNSIPEERGIIHVNSFSTSVDLIGTPNLIRIAPPDVYTPNIFVFLANGNPLVILYNPGTVFSESLALNVQRVALSEGLTVTMVPIPTTDTSNNWLNLLPQTTQFQEILIISDFAFEYVEILRNNSPRFTFQLVFTDANANAPQLAPATFQFIQEHNPRLLQAFLNEIEIEMMIQLLNTWTALTGRVHPISAQTIQYIKTIDVSALVVLTRAQDRNKRRYYAGITLNEDLDNAISLYGYYDPSNFPNIRLDRLIYVSNGILYSGQPTLKLS